MCVRACAIARVRAHYIYISIYLTAMDNIITILDKFGFAVAIAVTLLVFAYRIVNRYIKYLQDTIKDLTAIIQANTTIYQKLYDYLTKS